MSDSGSSSEGNYHNVAAPVPDQAAVRRRARYQRNYRRRRRQIADGNIRGNIVLSSSEEDMSDDDSYQGITSSESDIAGESPSDENPEVYEGDLPNMQQVEPENYEGPEVVGQEPEGIEGIRLEEGNIEGNRADQFVESEADSGTGDERNDSDVLSGGSVETSESERSDSSSDEEGIDGGRLLNGSPLSVGETMLALLCFFLRHKLSGQCLSDLLNLIRLICPPMNGCLKTLYKFKKHFSMVGLGLIVLHYFCPNCEIPIQGKDAACEQCGEANNASYFLELPLLKQLQDMFSRAGFYEAIQYRFLRRKKFQNNIEDIYDSEIYKQEMQNGFLSNPSNISFLWYSDGIAIYKSTNFSIWPMFLVINELNFKSRTKRENIILAGIWFGKKKPNPNIFLSPLHHERRTLWR